MKTFNRTEISLAAKIWKKYYFNINSAHTLNFFEFCDRLNVRWYAVYDYMCGNAFLNHRFTPHFKNQTSTWDDVLYSMTEVQEAYNTFSDFQSFVRFKCHIWHSGQAWHRIWVDWNDKVRYVEMFKRKPRAQTLPTNYVKRRTCGYDVDRWKRQGITLNQFKARLINA